MNQISVSSTKGTKPTSIRVGYGDNDLVAIYDLNKYAEVENIINHEFYDNISHENDISLIKLKKPLTFSEAVQPACLPSSDHFRNASYTNHKTLQVIFYFLFNFLSKPEFD